jgi:hypothetical protein
MSKFYSRRESGSALRARPPSGSLRSVPAGPCLAARLQSSSRNTCSSRGGRAHPLAARLIPNGDARRWAPR